MKLSEKIKQLRKKKNWTQEKLANKIGLQRKQIWLYENDEAKPSFETLQNLAEVFGVPADFLVSEIDEQSIDSIGINDKELYRYFQAIEKMPLELKEALKVILKGLIDTLNIDTTKK